MTRHEEQCLCCKEGQPTERPRTCPVCQHVFKGNGWDGIDAHWRSKHEQVMAYESFWEGLCTDHRGSPRGPSGTGRGKKKASAKQVEEDAEEPLSPTLSVIRPRPVAMPEGIVNVMENVGNVMYLSSGLSRENPITGDADKFLIQLTRQVESAFVTLAALFGGQTAALDDVVEARVLMEELQAWINLARMKRSGRAASEPLHIPDGTWASAEKLARTGRRLAHFWMAAHPERRNEPFNIDPDLDQASLECLEVLDEAGATSEASRRNADYIGKQAQGGDAGTVKKALAYLAKSKLVGSKGGRTGGSWITDYGRAVLLRKREQR